MFDTVCTAKHPLQSSGLATRDLDDVGTGLVSFEDLKRTKGSPQNQSGSIWDIGVSMIVTVSAKLTLLSRGIKNELIC